MVQSLWLVGKEEVKLSIGVFTTPLLDRTFLLLFVVAKKSVRFIYGGRGETCKS